MKKYSNIKTTIGILLITLIVFFYSKMTDETIKKNELVEVTGILKDKPSLANLAGDMPRKCIKLTIVENENVYYLIDCAYDMILEQDVLNIKVGSRVYFLIKKEEINIKKPLVYELSSVSKKNKHLSLSDYNKCINNKWKILVPLIIVISIVLAYNILQIFVFKPQN